MPYDDRQDRITHSNRCILCIGIRPTDYTKKRKKKKKNGRKTNENSPYREFDVIT